MLYPMGFRCMPCRTTLTDANASRPPALYADLAAHLMQRARRLYANDAMLPHLQQTVVAFDSTTFELCLSLFGWARVDSQRAAIKLHAALDLNGPIPSFLSLTDARTADVTLLERLPLEPGAIYVIDRGYLDFARLWRVHQAGAFFVIRAKRGMHFVRHRSQPVDTTTGLRSDHIGLLGHPASFGCFPTHLRRVRYCDAQTGVHYVYLTNLMQLPALTIADIYRSRWQIELFFRWIKQHLRLLRFYGYNRNAVETQIWIALSSYLLLAIVRKETGSPLCLHRISQVVSVSLFERMPLHQLLTSKLHRNESPHSDNQLWFMDL
jgi:hypothetical protein